MEDLDYKNTKSNKNLKINNNLSSTQKDIDTILEILQKETIKFPPPIKRQIAFEKNLCRYENKSITKINNYFKEN